MSKKYYAGYSYLGIRFTYDSPCWSVYAFDSKAARDKYVEQHELDDNNNVVMEAITRREAERILGCSIDSPRVHTISLDDAVELRF